MKTVINHKTPIIHCPHCGAQYIPGEIYMPGAFLGKPEDIVRDSFGKLLYDDYQVGEEPDMIERYICDYCDKPFIVEAAITYKTMAEEPEKDFSTQYVSLLD
jgi:DNA-directed RNA polymerase subunit RPC12/RpoP